MTRGPNPVFDWVTVPTGQVVRGTPVADIDRVVLAHEDLDLPRSYFAKEAPRATLPVESFVMSRTPVTIAQWQLFAAESRARPATGDPQHPVDGRSWREARDFTLWLGRRLGGVVRLPTELEWERACRGDDDREYPWGNVFAVGHANLAEARLGMTTPVGAFPSGASPFGFLDMAGNVDEWTDTPFAPYPGAPSDVPLRESWALDEHVTRGGSFRQHRDLARCARRHGVYPGETGAGFRVVLKQT